MSDHVLGKVVFGPDGPEGRRPSVLQLEQQGVVQRAVVAQREADAALVEAAGCLYGEDCRVDLSPPGEREYRYRWASSPDEHAARCPIHLAAKIRGQA